MSFDDVYKEKYIHHIILWLFLGKGIKRFPVFFHWNMSHENMASYFFLCHVRSVFMS